MKNNMLNSKLFHIPFTSARAYISTVFQIPFTITGAYCITVFHKPFTNTNLQNSTYNLVDNTKRRSLFQWSHASCSKEPTQRSLRQSYYNCVVTANKIKTMNSLWLFFFSVNSFVGCITIYRFTILITGFLKAIWTFSKFLSMNIILENHFLWLDCNEHWTIFIDYSLSLYILYLYIYWLFAFIIYTI